MSAVQIGQGIWRYDTSNPLSFTYVLPGNTMAGKVVECQSLQQASAAGQVAVALFQKAGAKAASFGSAAQGNGKMLDYIQLVLPAAANRGEAEKIITDYVLRARGDISLSLVSRTLLLTQQDLESAARRHFPQYGENNPIAGIRGIIDEFNRIVAQPHDGRVEFDRYFIATETTPQYNKGEGVVAVKLFNSCATCQLKSVSVGRQLHNMLRHFLPAVVHKLTMK